MNLYKCNVCGAMGVTLDHKCNKAQVMQSVGVDLMKAGCALTILIPAALFLVVIILAVLFG